MRNNYFHNEVQKIGEVYDCHSVGFNHEFFDYNCTKHNLIENNQFELGLTHNVGGSGATAIVHIVGK